MTNEMFEKAIDAANDSGYYRARVNFLEGLLYTLMDCAELSYSGKTLQISSDKFTTILRTFDSESVGTTIGVLKEEKENNYDG